MCDRQARPPSLVNCHSQNLVSEYKGGFFITRYLHLILNCCVGLFCLLHKTCFKESGSFKADENRWKINTEQLQVHHLVHT